MTHIPFDTRTIKYEDHPFKNTKSKIQLKVSGTARISEDGPPSEPYEYFDGKMRQNGAGMGNIRQKRRKQFPQKIELIEEIFQPQIKNVLKKIYSEFIKNGNFSKN